MIVYRADWVLPIAEPPISGGWIAIEDGRIAALGAGSPAGAIDLGRVALLPALVNAHTHLELSHLRGLVPPAGRFVDWVRALLARRRLDADPRAPEILAAARAGIQEARASGTGLLADVGNTLITASLLAEAEMPSRVCHELLGFACPDPGRRVAEARATLAGASAAHPDVRESLAAHAPYSVSAGLFAAIREDLDAHPLDVSSVHLAESPEEVELIDRGTGAWRECLIELGAWPDGWRAPGGTPVRYLADAGFLDARTLAVHGVQCSGNDLARLRAVGTTIVSCPRSNRHVGVGDPPLELFYASGVAVAFGTDSLASVGDLNMFAELAAARRLAPRVSARHLLDSATRQGARALGWGDELGSLEAGKRAALIAVRVPDSVVDVEEWLVSGIDAHMIQWVSPSYPAPSHAAPSLLAPSHFAPSHPGPSYPGT